MNKRQWLILLGGGAAIALLIALGTSTSHSTLAGPVAEYAPGVYSQTFTDQVMPLWAVASCLGLIVLTGVLVYQSRS